MTPSPVQIAAADQFDAAVREATDAILALAADMAVPVQHYEPTAFVLDYLDEIRETVAATEDALCPHLRLTPPAFAVAHALLHTRGRLHCDECALEAQLPMVLAGSRRRVQIVCDICRGAAAPPYVGVIGVGSLVVTWTVCGGCRPLVNDAEVPS